MKKVAIMLGAMMAGLLVSTYGMGYLLFHQTKVSDEEIFISRISAVPYKKTEYAVNLKTGDEEIAIYSLFGQTWFINYGGECRCVTSVHKIDSYYVALAHAHEEGQVYYSTGRTVHKMVQYEQVRHKFEEGLALRNELKERYAKILSP